MGKRKKKELLSADGTPYTPWQRRTRIICILMIVWAVVEIAVGTGFITVAQLGLFAPIFELMGPILVGYNTIIGGVFNLVVGLLGVRSARNPYKSAAFFWLVIVNAVLMSWDFASAWSRGMVSLSAVVSLLLVLLLAACAWNVRGQTGYFDRHPYPEDEDEMADEVKKARQDEHNLNTKKGNEGKNVE